MPKFGYAVKYNGKYYAAGADIPEAAPVEEAAQEPADEAQEPAEAEVEATVEEQKEPAEKAPKRRKKGDA